MNRLANTSLWSALLLPLLLSLLLWAPSSWAQLDLKQLHQEQLGNGLSLLILEEHSFPSVSVQMLYRVGGRDESAGRSGMAHFLEHMAFRSSENFPDTEVVSRIYAAGGEWHGYTWIDQTTYFATVPADQLDLLLRIEADRMQRLLIEPRWIEPEKGAVLAEMHGYENDLAAVLHDAVVFSAIQGHPYRNNVIGWEADILALQHAEVLEFYRQHYRAANAVLVVVGDVIAEDVRMQVMELFGDFPPSDPTPLPHTLDPPQQGERRIELLGAGDSSYFEIAWHAPAANHPDFAAMLVFQQWLSGGSGLNFMQEYGTTAARPGSALFGEIEGLSSWYPPAAQDYLFSISGVIAPGGDSETAENIIEDKIRAVRAGLISEADILRSRERVLEELVYDLGTHEETAHELAFFKGLNALDEWLALPEKIESVTRDQVIQLAQSRFQPWQRTIGWYRAGEKLAVSGSVPTGENTLEKDVDSTVSLPRLDTNSGLKRKAQLPDTPLPGPMAIILDNGLPVLVQKNPASPSAFVSLVINGNQWEGSSYLQTDSPVWGASSLGSASLPGDLEATLSKLLTELGQLRPSPQSQIASDEPSTRLEAMAAQMLGIEESAQAQQAGLSLVLLSGQIDDASWLRIQSVLGEQVRPVQQPAATMNFGAKDLRLNWPRDLAQAQLAYVVPAPLPNAPESLYWRALKYILSHDYEGRLGKEAISNRGLAYYIDSRYNSDGRQAWISLSTGVDPEKSQALEALFREKIQQLAADPPSDVEVAEARNHMIGRLQTKRQSNAELTQGLGEQWLWYGRLLTLEEQQSAIEQLDRQKLKATVGKFSSGAFAIIEAGKSPENVTD